MSESNEVRGLLLRISSTELKKLIEKRIEFHKMRVVACEKKLPELEEKQKQVVAEDELFAERAEAQGKAMSVANSFRNHQSELQVWLNRFQHHTNKVTVFSFRRDYLMMDKSYVLDENDLRELEVLPPQGY